MSYTQPCADPSNNPNDWFISKDGKQYSDEDLTTEEEVRLMLKDAEEVGLTVTWDAAWDQLEALGKRDALTRRRHAKDKCFTECYFRLQCLDRALRDQPAHGTWGGYDEDELQVLYEKLNARRTTS